MCHQAGFTPRANMGRHPVPFEQAIFPDGQGEDVPPAHDLGLHEVKDKIAQAVHDELALVEFVGFNHMWESADNQIGLSTITITLAEKEILSPFAVVVTDHVRMRIAFQTRTAIESTLSGSPCS